MQKVYVERLCKEIQSMFPSLPILNVILHHELLWFVPPFLPTFFWYDSTYPLVLFDGVNRLDAIDVILLVHVAKPFLRHVATFLTFCHNHYFSILLQLTPILILALCRNFGALARLRYHPPHLIVVAVVGGGCGGEVVVLIVAMMMIVESS